MFCFGENSIYGAMVLREKEWHKERVNESVFVSVCLDLVCDDRYALVPNPHRNMAVSRHHTHLAI